MLIAGAVVPEWQLDMHARQSATAAAGSHEPHPLCTLMHKRETQTTAVVGRQGRRKTFAETQSQAESDRSGTNKATW